MAVEADEQTNGGRRAMQIVLYPHPALRWKSKPLKRVDAELRRIVSEMFDCMYEAGGIGLAANQVELPYQLFVLNLSADAEQPQHEQVFINPVVARRKGTVEEEEGCLSLPDVYAPVRRSKQVVVTAYDLEGNEISVEAEGLAARALQHEIDHLHGVLFIDKLSDLARASLAEALELFQRQYEHRVDRGEIEPEPHIARRLEELESLRT